MARVFALFFILFWALPATAQEVTECYQEGQENDLNYIRVLAEPWEDNTRVFANGDVRIAILDTWDPANFAVHLMVLFLPSDWIEAEGRECRIVSDNQGYGFHQIDLTDMGAGYDPARGLVLTIPTERHAMKSPDITYGALEIVINRATNQVTAEFFQ